VTRAEEKAERRGGWASGVLKGGETRTAPTRDFGEGHGTAHVAGRGGVFALGSELRVHEQIHLSRAWSSAPGCKGGGESGG
jgi:hypothetical protein